MVVERREWKNTKESLPRQPTALSEHLLQPLLHHIQGWDQNFRGDGADVDDAAAFRHSTYANNSLCHVNHAEDVDGEFIFELLFFNLQERCVACSCCVVD